MKKSVVKKIALIVGIVFAVLICLGLIIYPNIEIRTEDKLFVCQYSDDISEFEENASYNERYFYNEKRDISIENFDIKKFLFFYVLELEFIEGDARQTQFILEEEYIENWLENAVITSNDSNIDIAKLIEGKEAIVSNTRYLGNEYNSCIFYQLDGKYEELYVFYVDEMLVIQVGSPDECPRFIAYK